MKTNPYKVGDRVYLYDASGERNSFTITAIVNDQLQDENNHWWHFKCIQGRLVKRKRKCSECALSEDTLKHQGELLKTLGEQVVDAGRRNIALCEKLASYEEKLAVYENAEKYWVRVSDHKHDGLFKVSSWLYNNRSELNIDGYHWQVAVIQKKKASEE